jgi:hypothetical protein
MGAALLQCVERDGARRSSRAIDCSCASNRATFVAVMQPTDLELEGKPARSASSPWIQSRSTSYRCVQV